VVLDETIADCWAYYHCDITGLPAHEAARLIAALPDLWHVTPTDREPIVASAAYRAYRALQRANQPDDEIMDAAGLAAAGIRIRHVK
jgi:hypothetical protein